MQVYFSDFFGVDETVLEKYGAFNVSLINDLPLFMDPFLLFNSKKLVYQQLHEQIINYVRFLKGKAAEESLAAGLIASWYTFPEVKQNWLGFSKVGNSGQGLRDDFAYSLHANLNLLFSDFGSESMRICEVQTQKQLQFANYKVTQICFSGWCATRRCYN